MQQPPQPSSTEPSLLWLRLDVAGWQLMQEAPEVLQLAHTNGLDFMSLHFFNEPPTLPHPDNTQKLRRYYRTDLQMKGGALIEVEREKVNGNTGARTIFRFNHPEKKEPVYLGSLIFQFKSCSYVLKVQSLSGKDWALRERFVRGMVTANKSPEAQKALLKKWAVDPYMNKKTSTYSFNLSEARVYDHDFQDHALSRLRRHLTAIAKGLTFDERVATLPPYQEQGFWQKLFK